MKKEITVCDSCQKEIKTDTTFRMKLETDHYIVPGSPGPDYDQKVLNLEFCEKCAKDIHNSLLNLERIL